MSENDDMEIGADLTDQERDLLPRGVIEWGGPARCTEELALACTRRSKREPPAGLKGATPTWSVVLRWEMLQMDKAAGIRHAVMVLGRSRAFEPLKARGVVAGYSMAKELMAERRGASCACRHVALRENLKRTVELPCGNAGDPERAPGSRSLRG